MSELSAGISPLTSTNDLLNLKADSLYTLLKAAYVEATEIERALQNAENATKEADKYNQILTNARKRYPKKAITDVMARCYHPDLAKQPGYKIYSPANIVVLGILFPFIAVYIVLRVLPNVQSTSIGLIAPLDIMQKILVIAGLADMIFIILGIIRNKKVKKNNGNIFNQVLQSRIAAANHVYADTQKTIDSAQAIYMIPKDYRYSFALSKMLTILENKRADDWMTLADKFEDYLHKLRMEQNSNEALEYQRFIAFRTDEAARAARTAATASSISAGINIAGLFT